MAKRLTIADVKREAAKHGATIEVDEGRTFAIYCDLPAGKCWNANGLHHLSSHCFSGDASWKQDVYGNAIREMAGGIQDCDGEDCDTCAARQDICPRCGEHETYCPSHSRPDDRECSCGFKFTV